MVTKIICFLKSAMFLSVELLRTFTHPRQSAVWTVCALASTRLATGHDSGEICIWDLANGALLRILKAHKGRGQF